MSFCPASPKRRIAVILNPTAGRGQAGRSLASIRRKLRQRDCDVVYYMTRSRGEAYTLAARAIAAGDRLIAAAGGDGTLHEVANAILDSKQDDVLLGLIPFGTGNDFARGVGLRGTLDRILDALLTGTPHAVDVGVIDGSGMEQPRFFLAAAGVGFVADTAMTVNEGIRGLSGPAAYIYGAVKTLRTFEPIELTLSIDGGMPVSSRAMLLSVSNVATTGGGIKIAPDAAPDDGRLDLCLVGRMSKGRLLRKLPAAFLGKHTGDEAVRMMRVRQVDIAAEPPCRLWIDGEIAGETPARFRILPGKLTMMLPKSAVSAQRDE